MRTRVSIAVGLIVVGLVWIGQGTGLFPGTSFMVDDRRWAAIGSALILVGLVLMVSARRARPPA